MTRHRFLAAALGAALLGGCGSDGIQEITTTRPGAAIRFYNFSVGAPSVNFYADGTKLTAVNSTTDTESTSGTAYGAVGNGGYYSSIAAGTYTLSGKISAATDKDLAISSTQATLGDARFYSYYLTGPYNTTAKTADAFLLEDAIPASIDFAVAQVRLVHAIANANPILLYARNPTTGVEVPIGGTTPIAYKGASAFTPVPVGVYTLIARYEGSTANLISRTDVSLSGARVYTIGARGDMTVTSTTAATRPFLDVTTNR